MSHNDECNELRCPPVVPPDAPDDFCIPVECCPEQIPTVKFPSPHTCLPQEVLEELEVRIRAANDLLLSLALSRRNGEDENREGLRRAFDGIIGQFVQIQLAKEGDKRKRLIRGHISFVGRDFVLLKAARDEKIVQFEDICSIKHPKVFREPIEGPELLKIDPCLRRDIAFNFGATVASSPELIQLFFGLDLKTFLCFQNKRHIRIRTKRSSFTGTFIDMNDHELCFIKGKRKKNIKREDICLIILRSEKKQRRRRRINRRRKRC